jgi:hypothetical protein
MISIESKISPDAKADIETKLFLQPMESTESDGFWFDGTPSNAHHLSSLFPNLTEIIREVTCDYNFTFELHYTNHSVRFLSKNKYV